MQKQNATNNKIVEELNIKIQKLIKQLESERIENKKREEELETRWKNEKVLTQD